MRSLPYSEESERAVLGAVLLDPQDVLSRIDLHPSEFYLAKHQVLFRVMRDLAGDGSVPDMRTVQARLETAGEFEEVGGLGYLAALDSDLPDIGRVEAYAAIVRENSNRRRLVQVAEEMARGARGGEGDLQKLLGIGFSALTNIQASSAPDSYRPLATIGEEVMALLEDQAEKGPGHGINTPWPRLNKILDHLEPGEVYLVQGPPGAGKTAFMLQLAEHIAFKLEKVAAVVSLEMKRAGVVKRLLSRRTGISFQKIRSTDIRNLFTQDDWDLVVKETRQWKSGDIPLEIDDHPFQSAEEIAARLRRLHRCRRSIAVFLVDWAGLIESSSKHADQRDRDLLHTGYVLRGVAADLGLPCVLFSQVTQEAINDIMAGKPPRMHQTAGGQALPRLAFCQIWLVRDIAEDGTLKNSGKFLVTKHRDGPLGTVDVEFDGPTMTWKEI